MSCEYGGCELQAEGWLSVQWSVVDFLRWDMCHDHLWQTRDEYEGSTRDGHDLVVLDVHYYETP